jgi:acyl-coenzyme A synthetase/AMP-(fatty) acid ligase/acyl carrier protein
LEHLKKVEGRLYALRLVVVGADIWYRHEFDEVVARCSPKARVIGSYGVSEVTIDNTWYEDSAAGGEGGRDGDRSVPIGRPLTGCRVYVLDQRLEPMPKGVPGELFLAGRGVARGYHGRPALTAERFVPDPFATLAGDRLYRTGDLCRFLPAGDLEILGRVDHQVKVRGLRVEPGEIETVLTALEQVRRAAVVAREDPRTPGEQRLVAFVVTADAEQAPSQSRFGEELRGALKGVLPAALVPSSIIALEEMPLTPNGKIDRRALARLPLPAEDEDRSELAGYVEPRTEAEEMLAEIYGELLGLTQVGAYDNFFDLGGHSLLATRAVARIRDAFEIDLPLRDLFEAPTVARLAMVVEELIIAELEGLSDEEAASLL